MLMSKTIKIFFDTVVKHIFSNASKVRSISAQERLRTSIISSPVLGISASAFLILSLFSTGLHADELNVYSARQEALIKPLLDDFTKDTGIEVNLVTGKGDALISRLKSEGQFSPADLLIVADVGRLVRAKKAGVTQQLPSSLLDQVEQRYKDQDGHWIALTKRARPIMYKLGAFDPANVNSFQDLTGEEYSNSICIRSSSNIYNQSMVGSLIELWGEEKTLMWAKGLVDNFARSPKGGDRDQIKALVAGQCKLAIANTYYLGGMLDSQDSETREIAEQVGVIWNDQISSASQKAMGVHVNVSGAVMTKYAKNTDNAKKLLAYMLTKDAQQWYAQVNHEYPVIEGVELSQQLKKFGTYKAQQVNLSKVGENNGKALMLMDKAGWK